MNWPSTYDLNKGIEDMEKYIIKIHLRDVYYRERPTNAIFVWEEFINKAMNTEEYDFYERWSEYDCSANRTYEYGIAETLALLNKIDKLYDDIYGEKWAYDTLTYKKVVNMYAYLYVNSEGVEWLMLNKAEYDAYADEMDADDSEDEECECEEEIYNGSKDFPPNETDETCPICLEAYDRELGRLKDGIRNSIYESNCPHSSCCMCWDTMYKQNNDTYCCPICKRDITHWLKTHYNSDDEDDDDYDDMCDCCVKGWDNPNQYGRCNCVCSRGCGLLRVCKYKCLDKK